jgi:penicillin-binding protein 1A
MKRRVVFRRAARAEFKAAEIRYEPTKARARNALQLVDALRDAVVKGTGAAIRRRYGITADVAGKTGTTQENTDGWFIDGLLRR